MASWDAKSVELKSHHLSFSLGHEQTSQASLATLISMDRIVSTSDHLAHVVLVALCNDFDVQYRALDLLDKLEARIGDANSAKRKASGDLNVCIQCSEAFTEDENGPSVCWYHDGKRISF